MIYWCTDVSVPISGPPLVMEVHDRDCRLGDPSLPSLFGREERDEVLGTCAFGTGNIAQQVEFTHENIYFHAIDLHPDLMAASGDSNCGGGLGTCISLC